MLEKYLKKTEFESYDDFINNFSINVPPNFNFSYDIVDEYAKTEPDKRLWSGVMTTTRKPFLLSQI